MKTVLIAFHGYKRSGKNTAADIITKWCESKGRVAESRAFADLVKLSAARSLGLTTNMNDAIVLINSLMKNSGELAITIPEQSIECVITGREYIKWFATEGHRDVFGKDFWVDQLLPIHYNWKQLWSPCDIAMITDLRFVNEAERVHELGGVVWEIDRGLEREDEHPSESRIPARLIDKTIDNSSSLEALEVTLIERIISRIHAIAGDEWNGLLTY